MERVIVHHDHCLHQQRRIVGFALIVPAGKPEQGVSDHLEWKLKSCGHGEKNDPKTVRYVTFKVFTSAKHNTKEVLRILRPKFVTTPHGL